jgi:hypothetical protein
MVARELTQVEGVDYHFQLIVRFRSNTGFDFKNSPSVSVFTILDQLSNGFLSPPQYYYGN